MFNEYFIKEAHKTVKKSNLTKCRSQKKEIERVFHNINLELYTNEFKF
jgi:hypothetical protein